MDYCPDVALKKSLFWGSASGETSTCEGKASLLLLQSRRFHTNVCSFRPSYLGNVIQNRDTRHDDSERLCAGLADELENLFLGVF